MGFKLSKRETTVVVVTAGVIVCALGYQFLFEPLVEKWGQLDETFVKRNLQLLKSQRILYQEDTIREAYEELQPYLKSERSEQEEISAILKEIENMASRSGVMIVRIKPGSSKQAGGFKEYRVDLVLESKITTLLNFLYSLETSKKLFEIDRVVIGAKGVRFDLLKATIQVTKLSIPKLKKIAPKKSSAPKKQ